MLARLLISGLFGAISFSVAVYVCYFGVSGNGQLLGKAPTTDDYIRVILLTGSYIGLPLLVGTACALFVEPRRLPWIALAFAVLGAYWLYSFESSFLLLLIYPFVIVASWFVGILCACRCKNFLALPILVFGVGLTLSAVVYYSQFTERQAEAKARALCMVARPGGRIEPILAHANEDSLHRDHVRWVQIFDSVKNGEGVLQVVYRGTSLIRLNTCEVQVTKGWVTSSSFRLE